MRFRALLACVCVVASLAVAGHAQSRRPAQAQPRGATILVGTHANAWSAAVVGVNGTSTALDSQLLTFCSAFGNASAATTIAVQLSADNTNFYTSNVSQVLSAAGNFGFNFTVGARYVRLTSSAAATITATLQCKGPQ